MLSTEAEEAIRFVHERLENVPAVWAVTGSAALALHKIETDVGDIDLQSDELGISLIEKALAEYMTGKVVFSSSSQFQSHFGQARFRDVQIELMGQLQLRRSDGAWETPVDVRQHRELRHLDGLPIPVMSLDYLEYAYGVLGRFEQVHRIRRRRTSLDA